LHEQFNPFKLKDCFQVFASELREKGITRVVVLLTEKEMDSYYDGILLSMYGAFGFQTIHYPVPDHDTPESLESFAALQNQLVQLTKTEQILIHSLEAIGRTGLIASGLIVALGDSAFKAMATVRNKTRGSIETKQQEQFLKDYAQLKMGATMKYVSEDSLHPRVSSSNGFWVKGGVIYDVTNATHVEFISKNAEKFGLNKKEVSDIYQRHDEAQTTEGTAREELVHLATSRGWIRVMHYSKPRDYWSIQCDHTEKRKEVISEFISWALANKVMIENDSAVILGYDDPRDVYAFACEEGGIKAYLSGAQ
jgi:protein-tyrosine phosphatase